MKTLINSIVKLADNLDKLGFKKDADKLDQIVAMAEHNEDFGELMSLFDGPVMFEDDEETPVHTRLTQVPEDFEAAITLEDAEAPVSTAKEPSRLDALKRRNEILKLKKLLKREEMEEAKDVGEKAVDEIKLPIAKPEDLDFEDEDENDADDELLKKKIEEDEPGTIEKIMDFMKTNPELLEKLLLMIV